MRCESSIGKRILLLLLVAQALLTTAFATAIVIYINHQMTAAFDSELRSRMTAVLAKVQTADEKAGGIEFNGQPNVIPNDDIFAIWDAHGGLIAASPHTTSKLRSIGDLYGTTSLRIGNRFYRGELWRSVPLLDQENEEISQPMPVVDLAYAMPSDSLRAKFWTVVTLAVAITCIWLALSSIIAWVSISKGLAPLNDLALMASTISARSWAFQPSRSVGSVAELRPLVQALQSLIKRLRNAFERERTFVSDAAHELKTAVAIQKSTLQVAANGPPNVADYRKGFDQALSDIDRLETLVMRMLSLASVENSSYDEHFVSTALEETIRAASDQVASLAKFRGIELHIERLVPTLVLGNAALLKTLWVSLLENALQHSARGSVITVAIDTSLPDRCEVVIADCGEGIAPEDLPKVFDRFYRADRSRSRATGGYGLGLAIAKAIVERHKASIAIESVLGRGTMVKVQFTCAMREQSQALSLS